MATEIAGREREEKEQATVMTAEFRFTTGAVSRYRSSRVEIDHSFRSRSHSVRSQNNAIYLQRRRTVLVKRAVRR